MKAKYPTDTSNKILHFEGHLSMDYFNVFPGFQLANYANVFSVYIGFLFLHGEIAYVKKSWRK